MQIGAYNRYGRTEQAGAIGVDPLGRESASPSARGGSARAEAGAAGVTVEISPQARNQATSSLDDKALKRLGLAECQTCKSRQYQDGSNDPGVSFKAATHVAPEQAAAAVAGHENEHVVREQAKAETQDREVVSQRVEIHTSVCPECGRAYVSGGTTTTVTKAADEAETQPDTPKSVDLMA